MRKDLISRLSRLEERTEQAGAPKFDLRPQISPIEWMQRYNPAGLALYLAENGETQ